MDLRLKATATIRSLSRGLKQRAALARAFLHQPDLLLLDEPYTGLDERAADVLDRFVSDVREAGRNVVMTTHDAARGWKHADRAVVFDRGSIVYETTTATTSYEDFHSAYREILSR
jgi:ABC-type multidrug transport system ATPase subunit